ncbi:MAG: hypothetical protein COA78_08680 [Blastopirellula sp.]|nr:MAG: hypothetical protein COA78_08680 [Blastopirellula sp.]
MLNRAYENRWIFNLIMVPLCICTLIETTPRFTDLQGKMQLSIYPLLKFVRLEQGSWELFAPTPDHVNVRVGAHIYWNDGGYTLWQTPDWHSMSRWEKFRNFRRMAFFDGLWRPESELAWTPFCKNLSRQYCRSDRSIESIVLFVERDVIAPPKDNWRPAYAVPRYSTYQQLIIWRPNE